MDFSRKEEKFDSLAKIFGKSFAGFRVITTFATAKRQKSYRKVSKFKSMARSSIG